MDLLDDLTPAQREAVTHGAGPLLIIAGPGSGKTRVITRRIVHLMQEHGVRPSSILAVTFTNKAAGEMRDRVVAALPQGLMQDARGGRSLRIKTFHSFGVELLRFHADRFGLDRNFTIYDVDDRKRLIKESLEAANIDNVQFTPERIEGAISRAKNHLHTPERYAAQADDYFAQTVARVYPIYEKKLRAANAVDFDDLLLMPAMALKHDEEFRAELDNRFRYILIDEYQDTNQAQYVVARQLSIDHPNLCVVGDPDQSVYAWRGANIRNILDFERDFPAAKVVKLERNYRSTKHILDAAGHLIAHNRQRKPKRLTTENGQGAPVHVLTYATGLDEADGVVRRIRDAVEAKKHSYRDFAVFFRINALSRALESAFLKYQVPFQIVRGLAFFERKENRDVLAYLRLLFNPRDELAFMRVVNEPARGIGKVSLEHLRTYAEARDVSLLTAAEQVSQIPTIKGKAATGLRDFAALMRKLADLVELPADEVIRQVIDASGYRKMLATRSDAEDQERLANVEELITAASQFTAEDPGRTIADFLESVTLASDQDAWNREQDQVSVMTLHAAKGLEFPVVFMLAVEEGLLPHERSRHNNDELEEERRLAFVGMTRAEQELYICHAQLREFRGQTRYAVPSVFLGELPQEGIEHLDFSGHTSSQQQVMDEWRSGGGRSAESGWRDAGVRPRSTREPVQPLPVAPAAGGTAYAVGMIVEYLEYGVGRISEVSGYGILRKIKVRFARAGERAFIADKAKLTVVPGK